MALLLVVSASAVSAETLMMPNRPALRNVSEVVWGITTQANGSAYTMDFGDGNIVNGNVADRSYIVFNHTYALAGTFTATLTVGVESATTQISVYDPAALSAFDLRGVNINRAIENGLRYLWVNQSQRTTFDTVATTSWGNYPGSITALSVLAFENHGYLLPNNNSTPTGIYQKYAVQRGLNYLATAMAQINLTAQTNGDPCAGTGLGAAPCIGLNNNVDGDQGYSTAVMLLPFAGSTAPSRTMGAFGPALASGQTYSSIVQRLTATVSWGQIDTCNGRGGWHYGLSNNGCDTSDGSTDGWDLLALLDSGASGTPIGAFVKSEWTNFALPSGLNTDGSFDYNSDGNPASNNSVNLAKAGVAMQGMFYAGLPLSDPLVQQTLSYINSHWTVFTGMSFQCGNGTYNLGCSYGMFNIFKGLTLYGVPTLTGSTRAAGPGTIPAGDWYAEYVDWLVANQTSPTLTTGGNWNGLYFSCCESNAAADAAIAELILSPVALIQPDPTTFSTVGLSPATATNPPNTNHTVTATAVSSTGAPVPGATISFLVLTGPNAGKTGSGVTNAAGQVSFTYTDTSVGPYPLNDTIQAFIGQVNSNLPSNIVTKTWALDIIVCDADGDKDVDNTDLVIIRNANGQVASGPNDPRDGNKDGVINVADVRYCSLRKTPPPPQ